VSTEGLQPAALQKVLSAERLADGTMPSAQEHHSMATPWAASQTYALFFDPGRTDWARTYGAAGAALATTTTETPAI